MFIATATFAAALGLSSVSQPKETALEPCQKILSNVKANLSTAGFTLDTTKKAGKASTLYYFSQEDGTLVRMLVIHRPDGDSLKLPDTLLRHIGHKTCISKDQSKASIHMDVVEIPDPAEKKGI